MLTATFLRVFGRDIKIAFLCICTLCLRKKCTNFETIQLKIIKIDFDDIWQKYSKYSRIEFACFSFPVGLLFCQLFVFQTGHRKQREF